MLCPTPVASLPPFTVYQVSIVSSYLVMSRLNWGKVFRRPYLPQGPPVPGRGQMGANWRSIMGIAMHLGISAPNGNVRQKSEESWRRQMKYLYEFKTNPALSGTVRTNGCHFAYWFVAGRKMSPWPHEGRTASDDLDCCRQGN